MTEHFTESLFENKKPDSKVKFIDHKIMVVLPFPAFKTMQSRESDIDDFIASIPKQKWIINDEDLSQDLVPQVKALFGGETPDLDAKKNFGRSRRLTLTRDAIQDYVQSSASPISIVDKLASERIKGIIGLDWQADDLEVIYERVDLYLFPTGIAFICPLFSYKLSNRVLDSVANNTKKQGLLVAELNYSITDAKSLASMNTEPHAVQSFFNAVYGSFTPSQEMQVCLRPRRRPFMITFLSDPWSDQDDDSLEERTLYLAHRYTRDYSPLTKKNAPSFMQIFKEVFYSVSADGACILIRRSGAPFLDEFYKLAFRPAHLPMLLMTLHERVYLSTVAFWLAAKHSTPRNRVRRAFRLLGEISLARVLQKALLDYRLNCRFEMSSENAVHEKTLQFMRKSLSIQSIHNEVINNVEQFEKQVAAKMRFFWTSVTSSVTVLTMVVGFVWLVLHELDVVPKSAISFFIKVGKILFNFYATTPT